MAAPLPLVVQVAFGSVGSPAVLRGVTKGNAIIVMTAFYRAVSTGSLEAVPVTSNPDSGTFLTAIGSRQSLVAGTVDFGGSAYYLGTPRCGGGDHTITPEANTKAYVTAIEVQNLSKVVDLNDRTQSSGSGDTLSHAETADLAQGLNETRESIELLIGNCVVGTANGSADIAFTDPPSGYTTLQKNVNDIADVAFLHCYRVVTRIGSYAVSFNWAAPLVLNSDTAMLSTYYGLTDLAALPAISGGDLYI
jgi:hypothetical protein